MNLIKHKHERKHLRSCNCRVPRVQYAREQWNVPYVAYTATLGFSWIHYILLPVTMDEAFLDVSHVGAQQLLDYGRQIRATVWQCTGIPVSVGIASTKTLAKVATEVVKNNPCLQGVLNLIQYSEAELDELLASIALKEVWGIGSRFTNRLQARSNIFTAKDLKYAHDHWIRNRFSVMVHGTVLVLLGIACIPVETEPKPKKSIMTAKSFS